MKSTSLLFTTTRNRYTFIIALLCCGTFLSKQSAAQDYRLGLGVRLSNSTPTINSSFSAKYFIHERSAVEGLVSWGSRFGVGALLELHQSFAGAQGLRWFYGVGPYVGWQDSETFLGPMGVLGLDYKFPNAPVNLSLDWKPELDIIPEINFVPDAFALTVRFTLK
ncbi:hypothetical protein [Paraflavitalea sp. CAU 1676]|uniref:hypothetical protein n=1 Tax=Paraflavitalea sp. CAU 1676 TaxID=3032598 RepID=UPI0023DA84FB|nr:hypothetical protein [Paraflavitalea sp. CAU 1676]MDF2192816.1 hypothetical protein [Paraflavitalea sp. CAU 1676]